MADLRKVVLWVTGIIALLIVAASVVLIFRLGSIDMPERPVLSTSSSKDVQEAKEKEIANYKELVASLEERKTNVFDLIVIKTLMPLFEFLIVSVLGYIFTEAAFRAFTNYTAKKYNDT